MTTTPRYDSIAYLLHASSTKRDVARIRGNDEQQLIEMSHWNCYNKAGQLIDRAIVELRRERRQQAGKALWCALKAKVLFDTRAGMLT